MPGPAPGTRRRSVLVGDLDLESGRTLPGVRIAYETWGRLAEDRSNAVLVLHALTGDSHVVGEAGPDQPTPGWWPGLIGPGRPLDTDRWFVVAPNVLGGCRGTTGPSSPAPDGRPMGRALAESTFHHFADYNWDLDRGAPSFVTEPPGTEIKADPPHTERPI